MSIKSVFTAKQTVEEVVSDLKGQLGGIELNSLIYFASSSYDQEALSKQMAEAFGDNVFGCSTSGELTSGKMLKNSVVAMAFSKETIGDIKIEVVSNIKEDAKLKGAAEAFTQHYGEPFSTMDFKKYVGIILFDGLTGAEERVMDKLGDMTNITFIGGSAGDDLKFQTTYVHANGKVYTNAAILALLKPAVGFDFIKTQSFCALSKKLIATKVNEKTREVIEFDGKPAVEAYAEAVGTSATDAAGKFMSNPVGLIAGDEIFVRSPQQVKESGMAFYCNILEGMEVSILESTDIVKDTKEAVEAKKNELGSISGIINFNCILRTLELDQRGLADAYGEVFANIPTVGFSTYGEAYIGHINQTATMLVFK